MEKQLHYRYSKITLDEFALLEETCDAKASINFNNEIQFNFDTKSGVVQCVDTLTAKQNEKKLFKISVSAYFQIKPEDVTSLKTGNKYTIPIGILIQFASLNYGTLRGVLFSKLQDTMFNFIVVPPLYMQQIIKEPFIVEEK